MYRTPQERREFAKYDSWRLESPWEAEDDAERQDVPEPEPDDSDDYFEPWDGDL